MRDEFSEPAKTTPRPGDRLIAGGVALFIFGFFALEILSNFEVKKLGALFMILIWPLLLALHEAGHALAAHALGFRVCRIVIGLGRPIARFRVGGVPVEFRLFPAGGYVVPAPKELSGARLKSSLIYAAGPGIELALLLLIVVVVGPRLLEPSSELGTLFVQATSVAIVLGALFNLVPLPVQDGVTDGLGMISSFFRSDSFLRRQIALPFKLDAESLRAEGRDDAALEVLRGGAAAHRDNVFLSLEVAGELIERARPDEAGRTLEPLLEGTVYVPVEKTAVLVALARSARRLGGEDGRAAAEDYLERARAVLPESRSAALEWTALRTAQGRIHEALRILNELSFDGADEAEVLEADLRRAELEALRGHQEEARRLVRTIRERGGSGIELTELERRLGSA